MLQDGENAARQTFWDSTLRDIDEHADLIADQLHRATQEFPDLVRSFGLLLAYIRSRNTLLPDPSSSPPYPQFPENFCRRNRLICDCAAGDGPACDSFNPALVEASGTVDCNALWREYLQALEREREALLFLQGEQAMWSPAEGPRLQTITESEELYRRYKASCLGLVSLP